MDEKTRRKRSYAAGYLLSLAGKPLPLNTKREPVAYLYNGVRLPKLPERDREMYPYAYISKVADSPTTWNLWLAAEFVSVAIGGGSVMMNNVPYSWYKTDGITWLHEKTSTGAAWVKAANLSDSVWANFNVADLDGGVYLAASEPIPVYE